MTPGGRAELERLKAKHHDQDRFGDATGLCYSCDKRWPCDASRLIAALEEALAHMLDAGYSEISTDRVLAKLAEG